MSPTISDLPQKLYETHTRCELTEQYPINASTVVDSNAYSAIGIDNSLSLENFKENLTIKPIKYDTTNKTFEFDIIGIDPPIANALRRVLIAETPTMAIEECVVHNNTSVMQDEVLVHRLGLIPIKHDPSEWEFRQDTQMSPYNTIVFRLNVKAPANIDGPYVVYSSDLQWIPIGNQKARFEGEPIRPVYENIPIIKLSSKQEINIECYCKKGVGKTHAKWSPVATTWYRMMPDIKLNNINHEESQRLVDCCPMNVFDIEDGLAIVKNPRACTACRECFSRKQSDLVDKVKVQRIKDHFIFTVESVDIPPEKLVVEALNVLCDKCDSIIRSLEKDDEEDDDVEEEEVEEEQE